MPSKKGHIPQCRNCHRDHWPFIKCDGVDAWRAKTDKKKREKAPYWVQQPQEGFSTWGDRTDQYVNMGGNLVLDRPIKQGGNVRVPDDWGWEGETE